MGLKIRENMDGYRWDWTVFLSTQLNLMEGKIAYPDEIFDDAKLNEMYEDVSYVPQN